MIERGFTPGIVGDVTGPSLTFETWAWQRDAGLMTERARP
jgi:hypothetical protein